MPGGRRQANGRPEAGNHHSTARPARTGRPSGGPWTAGSRAFLSQLPQTCNPIRQWSDVVPFCFGGTATMQTHTKRMKLLKKGQGNMHAEVTCQTQSCSTATGQCMLPPHPDEPKNTALPTTLNYIWHILCGRRLSSSRPVRKKTQFL